MAGVWKVLRLRNFWGQVQRRGVHVNTPEIGSRVGVFCSGGIWGFYAVLRREYCWGNLVWGFFGVLVGFPRRGSEEGGRLVFPPSHLEELLG
jgi:hypothetical protein